MLNSLEKLQKNIGLYFHWPFCELKCPYCDFNSHVREKINEADYQKAYLNELDFYKNYLQKKQIKTIFFGGGTPSLMPIKTLEAKINYLHKNFKIAENCEISIEANPASSEAEKFQNFKNLGINRLSIGVQSFDETRLKFLGRKHNAIEAIKAIEIAQKIFDNFSFDLIYATKNQTILEWEKELDFALQFNSKHISLYQLTIEKGTDFYRAKKAGDVKALEDEVAEKMYFLTSQKLKENGFKRYEVSNFAKAGFQCLHNINYWKYGEYLGVGAGAHSRISDKGQKRIAIYDIHNPENWLQAAINGGDFTQKKITLGRQQIIEEILYMGLRTIYGINFQHFKNLVGKDFFEIFDKTKIDFLVKEKMLKFSKNNQNIIATEKGILLHTSLVKKILSSAFSAFY